MQISIVKESSPVVTWGFPEGKRKLLGVGSKSYSYLIVGFLNAHNLRFTKLYTLNKYSLLYVNYTLIQP